MTLFPGGKRVRVYSEKGIRSIRANKVDEKVRGADTAYYFVNSLVKKGCWWMRCISRAWKLGM